MFVQPEHTGFLLSGAIEPSQCAAGEIIVLRVVGEVDLCTIPLLQAALDARLDQRPAYLVVDLARMTFCSARGLDLLTQTGRIAAATATRYAVTGVLPHIHRVWTLCWGEDRPICYPSTAAASLGIQAAEPAVQAHRPRQALANTSRPADFQRGRNGFAPTRLALT